MKVMALRNSALFLLTLLTPFLAWAAEFAVGAAPGRQAVLELTEFTLCELFKKSGESTGECVLAKAPGDVLTSLMKAGRIPDPYMDLNSQQLQWVDDRDWLHRAEFQYRPAEGKRTRLLFMGLDYFSKIELNGKVLVDRHEGMFSRVDLEVTDALDPSGRQVLEVTLFGVEGPKREGMLGINEFDRRKYLKTQMSFGWDFAPRLKGAGIWDRVYLYQTGPAAIRDVYVKAGTDGLVSVEVELFEPAGKEVEAQVEVYGKNVDHGPFASWLTFEPGEMKKTASLEVPDPKLWWPWDMGDQNLYRLEVSAYIGEELSDRVSETFGFREVRWGPNPDAPEGSADWVLFINGRREFIRGANWVPAESMYGRMDDSRYAKLIGLARSAGVNMLRLWGGGNRERRAFYDCCDREGVLTWQEFPFACVCIAGYPRTSGFKKVVEQESREMVRQLRNHPSLFLWCGGNEFNVKRNSHVVRIMENAVNTLDPSRRFIPASPYRGDSHNWVVWHMKGNLEDYFDDVSPLPSEFGVQSFPPLATLEKYISKEHLWPAGNDVLMHHDLDPEKMDKYVSAIGHKGDIESYIEASQVIQGHYLQRGIEHWRQRKFKTSGTALWMWNDPWPAVSWSVIDYELEPKHAYEVLKWTYNPVLVTAEFEDRKWSAGEEFEAEIMVVNDLHEAYPDADITASVCGGAPRNFHVSVLPDSLSPKIEYSAGIPAHCQKPWLDLRLVHDGNELSRNSYALWIHDPKGAGKTGRVLADLSHYLMSGAKHNRWKQK